MKKLGSRGRITCVASAAIALAATGLDCSSNDAASALSPLMDASTETNVVLDGGGDAAGEGGAVVVPQGRTLLWNVVANIDPGDGGAPDAGGEDASDAGDGGAAADAGDAAPPATTMPVAGAQVCVHQNAVIPCATTAADGTFTLSGLPSFTNVVLTVLKDGYRPTLRPIETASTDMDGTARPIALTSATAPDPAVPVTIDWQNKGQLTLFAIGPLVDAGPNAYGGDFGASVALTPASGSGPFFIHDDGTYALTATSFVGVAALYDNLDPGTYELTYTDAIHDCAPILSPFGQYGFPAPPTSVEFPIVAGYITGPVGIFCTAK
jgi:hypothetical protein